MPLGDDEFGGGSAVGYISQNLPGLEQNYMGLPLGELPEELRRERLYIDDFSRMPDVVLEHVVGIHSYKYLCWFNYREKEGVFCWRIGQLHTRSNFMRLDENYEPVGDDVYTGHVMTWPYGVDSYNFDINKINEYPFNMRGARW
jgi:hypothetical protein